MGVINQFITEGAPPCKNTVILPKTKKAGESKAWPTEVGEAFATNYLVGGIPWLTYC
jgi:hypothetical protein